MVATYNFGSVYNNEYVIQFLGQHLHFKYHFDACKLWSWNLVPSLGRWSWLLFLPLVIFSLL